MSGEEVDIPKETPVSWMQKTEERFRSIKEHAEAYPYVWASYIVIYGGLGAYMAYRWRKLRKTEDRVRALQEQLRKLNEAKGESTSATPSNGFDRLQK